MQRLAGKRLLIVGVCDVRKTFIFDVAAQNGIKCCSIGTVRADLLQDKVAKHIWYDTFCHQHDQKHCDAIINLVKAEFGEVDGCVTFWDDCIPLTALLCHCLGTPGLPYSGAVAAKKKSLTFETLKTTTGTLGQAVEQYCSLCYSIASLDDLEKSSQVIGFPAVLKGEYGGGGMSYKIVHDITESREHLSFVQSASPFDFHHLYYLGKGFGNECVLMELLEGSEHTVDLVLFHGELLCAFMIDKGTRTAQDTTVHSMSAMPSLLTLEKQNQVIRAAFECCLALSLDHGLINVDFMLTQSGPKLIEINARMAGFCHKDFIKVVYDVDLVHLAFLLACDTRPDIPGGHCLIPRYGEIMPNLSSKAVSSTGSETGHSEFSTSRVSCLSDSQDVPICFTLKPSCVIVGRAVYGWQSGSALRTSARPEFLQQLQKEGKLLFIQHEALLEEQRFDLPFCTLAVTSDNFSDATDKMERLCRDLGLEQGPVSFSCL